MGRYDVINSADLTLISTVNLSVPIYEHISYGGNEKRYLFHMKTIGWTVSNAIPSDYTFGIYLTCFQTDLFNCIYDEWYWDYNKRDNPINTMKILRNPCES